MHTCTKTSAVGPLCLVIYHLYALLWYGVMNIINPCLLYPFCRRRHFQYDSGWVCLPCGSCVPIPGPGIDVCSYASPACPFKTGVKETVQVSDLYLDKSFPNVSHKRNYLQYSFCQFTVGNHIGVCLVHLFSHHCYEYIGWLYWGK